MNNPLCPELLSLLRDNPKGLSEYDLFKQLECHPVMQNLEGLGQLSLFKKHFFVMNALYQLQKEFWQQDNVWLDISPLCIQFTAFGRDQNKEKNDGQGSDTEIDTAAVSEFCSLSSYYLEWKHFDEASEESVQSLLDTFWLKFEGLEQRDAALDILGLDQNATQATIVQRYRQLAARNHPDKGGDTDSFIAIRQAFEVLKGA